MKELLLCAIKRRGEPATASEAFDAAVALAMDAGWPRRTWTTTNVQKAAALLRGMADRGEIERAGSRTENGRAVPVWAPAPSADPLASRWNADAEIPDQPERCGEDHPLNDLTTRQKYIVFDLMETALENYARFNQEAHDMLRRHNTELRDASARAKRELLAAGIINEENQR